MSDRELIDELYALVRELHGKKQAEEIINTFEGVFASHEDEAERATIAEHWLDFYRLRQYRRMKRRRRPTMKERITPCSACGYPASHRHHLWDIATHGENKVTIQLCANCHELQHLMYNALVRDSEYSRKLALHTMFSFKLAPKTVEMVLEWCRATIRYEAQYGWVELRRASDEWVEDTLHWSEYWSKAHSAA